MRDEDLEKLEDALTNSYGELFRELLRKRAELTRRESKTRQNLNEQLGGEPGDEADKSVSDTSSDYFLKRSDEHRRELVEIDNALFRFRRGTYGVCESCEAEISLGRLKRLPYARLCIECQTELEQKNHQGPHNLRL
ncbi:MAG: TraR/DksA family transcriptional regulator [Bacteriovoracia bacterium]